MPEAAGGAPGPEASLDLEGLELARGGDLLVRRALARLPAGARLAVRGSHPHLAVELRALCRAEGHEILWPAAPPAPDTGGRAGIAPVVATVVAGAAAAARLRQAERAGDAEAGAPGAVVDHPPARWGLAARGALVEAGLPPFAFSLVDKDVVWSDDAGRLYAQGAASQWDPETAIPWSAPRAHPPEIEAAVVQVMTYLIENETAALLVPARFLSRIHPHFREVMQLLAQQAGDEARHIEVFTRRARLGGGPGGALGVSSVAGQLSLKTLLDEPDFAEAHFLLSVLGEGSFLALLRFLHRVAPDRATAEAVRLAAQDEARHVAFGLGHLARYAQRDSSLRGRLAAAVHGRHEALQRTAALSQDVFDALVVLAAGSFAPAAIGAGHDRVLELAREMDEGRRQRLERLGFTAGEAEALSALHTKNFM